MISYKEIENLSEERFEEKLALLEKKLVKELSVLGLEIGREISEQFAREVLFEIIAPIYFEPTEEEE